MAADVSYSTHQQTFRSLIVTPHMTSGDVLQVALAQIAPRLQPSNYQLIEKTPHGGELSAADNKYVTQCEIGGIL